jgi:maleate isomerase
MRERFVGYNESLRATADSFGGMPLDALCLACTGSSYLVGPDGEGELMADLAAGGAPRVNTAAGTIREVLSALGCRRIAVVSPYPAWLTELAVAYWRASGFEVADCIAVSQVVNIYAIQASQALDAARRLDLLQVDGIVLSGTGMPTLDAIQQLASEIRVPVVSSNLCTAWWFVSTVDRGAARDSPSPALRQLVDWLGA